MCFGATFSSKSPSSKVTWNVPFSFTLVMVPSCHVF